MAESGEPLEESGAVVVPAALSPADAPAFCRQIIGRLDEVGGGDGPLPIDIDGDSAGPCAIQILIATTRSASSRKLELQLSDRTRKLLDDIELDAAQE